MYANALACQRTDCGYYHNGLNDDFLGKVRRHCHLRHRLLELALQLQTRAVPRHVILCIVEFLEDGAILCRSGRPVSEPFGGEDILRSWIWVGRRRSDHMNQWATRACWGVS